MPVQRLNGWARRTARAALIVALSACTGCDTDGTRQSVRSPPECEIKEYPCSWAEVDVEVSRRTAALFEPALDRMYEQSPSALWEWLQTVPDLAEAGLVARDSTAIWFRLEGGRPAYVFGPHRHRRAVAPPGSEPEPVGAALPQEGPLLANLASPLGSALSHALDADMPGLRPNGAPRLEVTGRDRNQDTRVNQRDQRRALVMDPFNFELCYQSIEDRFATVKEKRQHGEAITAICEGRASPATLGLSPDQVYASGRRVKAELEQIPAYRGNVTLLEDTDADHRVIEAWDDYDVVHVTAHGAQDMVGFGSVWPLRKDEPLPPAPFPGAIPMMSRAGRFGPQRGAWAAGADYFQDKLPAGLDRTFVFLSACSSMEGPVELLELIQHLSGESSGVLGWNDPVAYDDNEFLGPPLYDLLGRGWTVRQALDSLRLRRSEFIQGSSDFGQVYLATEMLAYHGADLRIFEVVQLGDPTGISIGPVGDGAFLNRFLAGSLGDGADDSLTVHADVMALTEEQHSAVHVQLELDGIPVGDALPLDPEVRVGENRYRVRFTRVPLDQDLKADTDYELEAVASLPEGGESRYSVRLSGTGGCYWTANMGGLLTRRLDERGVEFVQTPVSNGVDLYTAVGTDETYGPNDPTGLTFSFQGQPEVGSFQLGQMGLITLMGGATFPLGYSQTGTLQLTQVKRDESGELAEVAGEFVVEFPSVLEFPEDEGPLRTNEGVVDVRGEFVWKDTCPELPALPLVPYYEQDTEGIQQQSPLPPRREDPNR